MPPPIMSPGSQTGGGPVVESPLLVEEPMAPVVPVVVVSGSPVEVTPAVVVPVMVAPVGSVVAMVALFDSEPALSVPVALALVVGTVAELVLGSVPVMVTVPVPESVARSPPVSLQAGRQMPSAASMVGCQFPKMVRISADYR